MPQKIEFVVTTYGEGRPWVVEATSRDSVELDDPAEFWAWAHVRWPAPRYGVRVEPGQGVRAA